MMPLTKAHTYGISAALLAPAAFIVVSGVLLVGFHLEAPNRVFGILLENPIGAVLFAPPLVLGAAGVAVLLNVARCCRVWFGPERGTVNLTVSLSGRWGSLLLASSALGLVSVILLYGAKYAIRAAVLEVLR